MVNLCIARSEEEYKVVRENLYEKRSRSVAREPLRQAQAWSRHHKLPWTSTGRKAQLSLMRELNLKTKNRGIDKQRNW